MGSLCSVQSGGSPPGAAGAPGTVGAFGAAGADGMQVAGLEAGLSQVVSLVSLL